MDGYKRAAEINIETNKVRRSVHTPDFPFPWVGSILKVRGVEL